MLYQLSYAGARVGVILGPSSEGGLSKTCGSALAHRRGVAGALAQNQAPPDREAKRSRELVRVPQPALDRVAQLAPGERPLVAQDPYDLLQVALDLDVFAHIAAYSLFPGPKPDDCAVARPERLEGRGDSDLRGREPEGSRLLQTGTDAHDRDLEAVRSCLSSVAPAASMLQQNIPRC